MTHSQRGLLSSQPQLTIFFLRKYITKSGGVRSTAEILPATPHVSLFLSYIYSDVNLQDILVRALINLPHNLTSKCVNVKVYIF